MKLFRPHLRLVTPQYSRHFATVLLKCCPNQSQWLQLWGHFGYHLHVTPIIYQEQGNALLGTCGVQFCWLFCETSPAKSSQLAWKIRHIFLVWMVQNISNLRLNVSKQVLLLMVLATLVFNEKPRLWELFICLLCMRALFRKSRNLFVCPASQSGVHTTSHGKRPLFLMGLVFQNNRLFCPWKCTQNASENAPQSTVAGCLKNPFLDSYLSWEHFLPEMANNFM